MCYRILENNVQVLPMIFYCKKKQTNFFGFPVNIDSREVLEPFDEILTKLNHKQLGLLFVYSQTVQSFSCMPYNVFIVSLMYTFAFYCTFPEVM